jgi:hypothetical protein
MGRDEKPLSTLQKRLISYTPNFSFAYMTQNTEIKFHSTDFTLDVGSPRLMVPRPCKLRDWLLNSSRDHFGLHRGKNVKVTTKFEVLKRRI